MFKQTSYVSLDKKNKIEMKKIIREVNKNYLNTSFTLQYVFNIKLCESTTLSNEEDLIGLIIDINKQNKRHYCYFYQGEFIKTGKPYISESIYMQMLKKQKLLQRIIPVEKEYEAINIPEIKTKQIFVFKIYILDK